ncbi:MAG: hypothetical protein ACK5DD_16400 [Cyclobacteriaceae bacterium]|jgi:hypothetical protein
MQRYYLIEALFVLLGVILVVTAIRYPKQIFVTLPLEIIKFPFRYVAGFLQLLLIPVELLVTWFANSMGWNVKWPRLRWLEVSGDADDRPYPATSKLKVDFATGDKFVYVLGSGKDLRGAVGDSLEVLEARYALTQFEFALNNQRQIARFPAGITFYDYHLFVQHLCGEFGFKNCVGVFRSDAIQYSVFQDPATVNNLVGFTADGKRFSIHMLSDLDKAQELRLNQKLNVDAEWLKGIVTPEVS